VVKACRRIAPGSVPSCTFSNQSDIFLDASPVPSVSRNVIAANGDMESMYESTGDTRSMELQGDGISDGAGTIGGGSGSWGRGDGGSDDQGNDEPLPDDLSRALAAGTLGSEMVARYKAFSRSRNPIARFLIAIPAFRTRILADPGFLFKLMVQELVGNGTALASEMVVRGKEIVNELEYVASDLIVGTVVEAGFVWLLAPRLASTSAVLNPGALTRFFESLPANAFEASTALRTYSVPLRMASFVNAGLQYAAIGMVAGVVGTAITYGLVASRKRFDSSYVPERPLPPILASSAGWAAFMAISSNTRFQAVEGIERLLHGILHSSGAQGAMLKSAIVALRFGNNYWGGVQFIKFFRLLGLHAVAE
jgi:Protein RETICULATA-related